MYSSTPSTESDITPPQLLIEFIIEQIQRGQQCILVGEKHMGSQNGLEALLEISQPLKDFAKVNNLNIAIMLEHLMLPDNTQPITEKQFKSNNWEEARQLKEKGFDVYALENSKTSPLQFIEQSDFNVINEFLEEQGLLQSFVKTMVKRYAKKHSTLNQKNPDMELNTENLQAIFSELMEYFGLETYRFLVLSFYTASEKRLIVPNIEFSNSIAQVAATDTICIAVVGAAHIPECYKEDRMLEEGMHQRLVDHEVRVVSSFVAYPRKLFTDAYHPSDNGLTYMPIENVVYAVPEIVKIIDTINEQIRQLDQEGIFQGSGANKIHSLQCLKDLLLNTENQQQSFAELVENWRNEISDFSGSKKNPLSHGKIIATSRSLLLSFQQQTSTEHCIENLVEKYGATALDQLIGIERYREPTETNIQTLGLGY